MNELFIPGSRLLPEIRFNKEGDFSIEGRSMSEDPHLFFKRIFKWINDSSELSEVSLNMKLEYFNTTSSKLLMELLTRLVSDIGKEKVKVNWHYEEGDDDMYESGRFFENILKCNFSYSSYDEDLSYN